MKQLLKIYGPDFAKNALYLFLLLWPISLIIYNITNKTDSYINIHYALFSLFYAMLFLYSYPLTRGLKWIIYAPIKKNHIIYFNIIFQFYKFLVIIFLFLVSKFFMAQIFSPKDFQVKMAPTMIEKTFNRLGKKAHNKEAVGPKNQEELKKVLSSKKVKNILFDSSVLFGLALAMIFFFTMIFSVSPQLIIENRYVTGPKIKDAFYFLKNNKAYILIIILLLFVAKIYYRKIGSPILIMSFCTAYIIFAFLYAYTSRLIYPKRSTYYVVALASICGLFFFMTSYRYSQGKLNDNNIELNAKVGEILFLKDFAPELNEEYVYQYLENDLSGEEIEEIMELFTPRSQLEIDEKSIIGPYTRIHHPFKKLNFDNIIKGKKNLNGLTASLGLFEVNRLTKSQVKLFLEQWSAIADSKKIIYRDYLNNIFKNYPFNKEDFNQYLLSHYKQQQIFALELLRLKNLQDWPTILYARLPNLSDEALFKASKILSDYFCSPVSISSLVLLGQKIKKSRNPATKFKGAPPFKRMCE